MNKPVVTIEVQNYGTIKIELYPEQAPQSVNNFIELIQTEFYNGLTFHRIIKNFMIQGGCPDGTGMGGPGYSILGEFPKNGVANNLKHSKGTLSMARSQMPNSAGSQFFICHVDTPHLDGSYAAFGRVISGIEVVDKIAAVATGFQDRPTEPVVIATMSVELNQYQPVEVKHY